MDEKLFRKIVEVNYLTTENAWRYRAILRFFYLQHEKLRYYLLPEEVLIYLQSDPHFSDYTLEQLQQDLAQLVEWKNLIPRQDMGKVKSIEEFRKKRFRYQCTPYSVEIERMVQTLEEKGDSFGGSLERTQFDRLLAALMKFTDQQAVLAMAPEELYAAWDDVYENFRRLTENAADYLAYLGSEQVEELMQTEAMLAYKDHLTEYLRNFIHGLQRSSFRIERLLQDVQPGFIDPVLERLADYHLSVPRLEAQPGRETVVERFREQWGSMLSWFLGRSGRESDMVYLQNTTTEAIRRITRFAQRLGERYHNLQSRRKDYLSLAGWFSNCTDLNDASRLFACVFGVAHTRHIFAARKETEDIYREIWDEKPTDLLVQPRVRHYRAKVRPQAVVSRQKEKQEALNEYLRQKEAEQRLLEQVMQEDRIVLSQVALQDPHVRKILLRWIGKCVSDRQREARTETGSKIRLLEKSAHPVQLQWDDGVLQMPDYEIQFIE